MSATTAAGARCVSGSVAAPLVLGWCWQVPHLTSAAGGLVLVGMVAGYGRGGLGGLGDGVLGDGHRVAAGTAVDFLPTPEGGGFPWLRRVFPGGRGTADAVSGVASGDRGACGSTLRRFPSTNSPLPRCRVGPRHPHHKPALNKKLLTYAWTIMRVCPTPTRGHPHTHTPPEARAT